MVQRGHLAQTVNIGGLTGEDVVLVDGLERFGGESQIHRVPGLVGEIYREAGEDRVHGLDSTETPTPMHAKSAIGQLQEHIHLPALNFAGGHHLLKFFFHKDRFVLASLIQDCQY
jgi:hypothetical protein